VISVKGNGLSLLLTGDISRVIEQRLASNSPLKHAIVTVPHHGSSTSSSETLISAAMPALALTSAASNNRFGFPRKEVLERYANAGIKTLNTADCGGIRVTTDASERFQVTSARVSRAAVWRWPGAIGCP
jgi:competence protein ComEC